MQRPGLRTVLASFAGTDKEVAVLLANSSNVATVCTIAAMGDDYITVIHQGMTKYIAIEHIAVVWGMQR